MTQLAPKVNKLLKNLDADIIDYIIEQGPEAIAALSHWPEDFLKKHDK